MRVAVGLAGIVLALSVVPVALSVAAVAKTIATETTVLMASETSKRKQIPNTIASERKRFLSVPQKPRFFGFTSQMVFMES